MGTNCPRGARTLSARQLRALALQITHEVRHSLTAISDYAECLGWAGALEPLARDRYARGVLAETQRVSRHLGYFLALAGQREPIAATALDLEDVLFGACAEIADLLGLRGSTLEASRLGLRCRMEWPPSVLTQIIVAGLDTMVTATAEGTAISLRVTESRTESVSLALTAPAEALAARLPRLLSYRAMALLLTERGGEVWRLQEGRQDGMVLRIPVDGRQVVSQDQYAVQRAS